MGFGPRVIGQQAYNEQAQAEAAGAGKFGSRVLGPPGAATAPRTGQSIVDLGHVRDGFAPPPPAAAQHPANAAIPQEIPDGISLDDIAKSLADNPLLAEPLYEQELARPSGAREEALEMFARAFPEGSGEHAEIGDLLAAKREQRAPELETAGKSGKPLTGAAKTARERAVAKRAARGQETPDT